MYTIKDYREQLDTVKVEIGTLKDIVDEFIEKWSDIKDSIEEMEDKAEYNLDEE